MKVKNTAPVYECDVCGRGYSTPAEAQACEMKSGRIERCEIGQVFTGRGGLVFMVIDYYKEGHSLYPIVMSLQTGEMYQFQNASGKFNLEYVVDPMRYYNEAMRRADTNLKAWADGNFREKEKEPSKFAPGPKPREEDVPTATVVPDPTVIAPTARELAMRERLKPLRKEESE